MTGGRNGKGYGVLPTPCGVSRFTTPFCTELSTFTHGRRLPYEADYFTRHCPQSYHGTGDLYSSTVLGGLMRGLSLGNALSLAADFVVACIEATASAENARWYAVEFESQIPLLCEMLDQRLKNN